MCIRDSNKTHEFAEYQLEFVGTDISEEGFRRGILGKFNVTRNGKDLGIHMPRINQYPGRMEPLPAPVSLSTWNHDLQLTLMSAEEDGSFAYLRAIKSPFIGWLWFSAAIMFAGTMVSVWPSQRKRPEQKQEAA